MSRFQVGYASVNINPPLGIGMMGYYIPRYAKGFLDDLEASALALSLGEETVLLVSVDTCLIFTEDCKAYLEQIAAATGIAYSNIFLSATHTHTGPLLAPTDMFEADMRTFWETVWQIWPSWPWQTEKTQKWALSRVGHRTGSPISAGIR